jgi:hypothetical protein
LIRGGGVEQLQAPHEDAFELRAVAAAVRLADVVDDSLVVGKLLDGCFGYASGEG